MSKHDIDYEKFVRVYGEYLRTVYPKEKVVVDQYLDALIKLHTELIPKLSANSPFRDLVENALMDTGLIRGVLH